MQTEFTGRQIVITKKLRLQAEVGLARIERILGKTGSAHVVLTTEKYRQTAEVTVKTKNLDIVGLCEEALMETALRDALCKVEKQALKHKNKLRAQKRQPKDEKQTAEAVSPRTRKATLLAPVRGDEAFPAADKKANAGKGSNGNGARKVANGHGTASTIPVLVHSFPARALVQEPHIMRSRDSVALRPMTLEEAVKEAEFRDRDVFVFRDNAGTVMVLHRKKDGKMELIEAP